MPSPSYLPVLANRSLSVATAADLPVTGTTAQTPTGLTVNLEAGKAYKVEVAAIFACSNVAPSVGFSFTGPAGATMKWNSTTGSGNYRPTISSVDSYTGSTSDRLTILIGRVVTAAVGGALTLTISTSDPAQTATLRADSWLQAVVVA